MSTTHLQPAHPAHSKMAEYYRIYVWEVPVRLYHGINALSMVLLCVTGYLIGAPHRIFYANEAYQLYWFGTVRFIHFLCAFIWVFNFLVRIYWGFVGNKYSNWRNYFPLTKEQRGEIREVICADVLQYCKNSRSYVGHNPLAAFTYFLTFLAFIFQAVTGFALYSSMSSSVLPSMFKFVIPLMGGEAVVRFWHHLFLWFFVVFIIVHVYLALYHDYVEGRGEISAIVSGWKFHHVDAAPDNKVKK